MLDGTLTLCDRVTGTTERGNDLRTLYKTGQGGLPALADAGIEIHTFSPSPVHPLALDTEQPPHNRLLRGIYSLGGLAAAELKQR